MEKHSYPEGPISPEQKEWIDLKNKPMYMANMGPYFDPDAAFMAKRMGKAYVFDLGEGDTEFHEMDQREQQRNLLLACKKFMVGTQMHKEPILKYPYATHRVVGRVNPGEVKRKARKAGERKRTRGEVQMLCKYMLFKNNKFMPGKMV